MKINEEKGYALVLSLLILVVFMVVALSLLGASYNSAKQNGIVEKNYQAVALAEMGVPYYKTSINHALEKSREWVLSEIEKDETTDYDEKDIFKMMVNKLPEFLKGEIVPVDTDASFEIKPDITRSAYPEIVINFTSRGIKEKEGAEEDFMLSAETTIPLRITAEGEGSDPSNGDFLKKITQPSVEDRCKNPENLYNSCNEVLLTTTKTYSGNNKRIQKDKIYSLSDLTLTGNGNNLEDSEIHVDGHFTLGKNMNNVKNLTLEVGGTADFKGHLDIEGSSAVYVGGNLKVGKHLTVSEGSKVCVAGELEVSGHKTISGKVFIKGEDQEAFYENCAEGLPVQEKAFIYWDDFKDNFEYQYGSKK
ncbi:polymer-forming cytoskeletal protein [Rossellomorea oryzaecorticis]|uniref:Polymer-forming cytoskeletal protein n=1 Tax=Rossellomorea oryzaecorticis TaxID=1396505 RepID=A0ABU9K624_9BACI